MKRKIIFLATISTILLAIIISCISIVFVASTAQTAHHDDTSTISARVHAQKPDNVCMTIAVQAFNAYVTKSPTRNEQIHKFFIPNAEGSHYTLDDFTPQNTVDVTMIGIISMTNNHVTCAIHNGLESPWVMQLVLHDNTWLVSSIHAPSDVFIHDKPHNDESVSQS